MRGLTLLLLWGCPKADPPPPPAPPPAPVVEEPAGDPPMPPPAPVEIAFLWPSETGCLMATHHTEVLRSGTMDISTLSGDGSGVIRALRGSDGLWEVAVLERSTRASHAPGDSGQLVVALERISGGIKPVLQISSDGTAVTSVTGEDVLTKNSSELDHLAGEMGTVGGALWKQSSPLRLAQASQERAWTALWSDGWSWAYGRTWIVDQPFEWTSPVTGNVLTATYRDVVPCKQNEDQPLCIRIEVEVVPSEASLSAAAAVNNARLRSGLRPDLMGPAKQVAYERVHTADLVIEAPTGLPWRWSTHIEDTVVYDTDGQRARMGLRDTNEVECDWRVAE